MTARAAIAWAAIALVFGASFALAVVAAGWLGLAGLIVAIFTGTALVLDALGAAPEDFR